MEQARAIVEKMLKNDEMSRWLGITVTKFEPGNVVCELTVTPQMVNGFHIAHGGITYSLADSALAFSVNSYGIHAVSVETSISHLKPVHVTDVLRTETTQLSLTKNIGVYLVAVYNQDHTEVASFKGTVYRTGKPWVV